jgi:nicotinamidase-related amidase
MQPASMDVAADMNGGLDPARTALVLVHMVKGVAGDVDTPFNQLFRRRAEEAAIIGVQARLLDRFRTAKAKVLYTAVTYKQGLPGVRPNSPLWRTLFDCVCLMEGTPAVEVIDDVAPDPMNRSSGGRRPTGSTARNSTPCSAWQASTTSCSAV